MVNGDGEMQSSPGGTTMTQGGVTNSSYVDELVALASTATAPYRTGTRTPSTLEPGGATTTRRPMVLLRWHHGMGDREVSRCRACDGTTGGAAGDSSISKAPQWRDDANDDRVQRHSQCDKQPLKLLNGFKPWRAAHHDAAGTWGDGGSPLVWNFNNRRRWTV